MGVSSVLLAVLLLVGSESFADDATLVEIPQGKVRGFTMTSRSGRNFNAYLGIPYARPPVGSLRFKSPQPADKWEGVLDATGMPKCTQKGDPKSTEDCLKIGIYTHNVNRSVPVMVAIHGGGFMYGDFPHLGPQFLMDEDVVVAGIHYRLGILGFLSYENIDLPGNWGMKDQVLALKWIKENIQYFGGNPNDVTIIGESAGGSSVYHHLISPMSKGLYQKAIIESGTSYAVWSLPPPGVAKSFAKRVSAALNCPDNSKDAVACLMTKNVSDFNTVNFSNQDILSPVFEAPGDGAFLSGPLSKVVHNPVPIIMGMTSAEGLMFSMPILDSGELKFKEFLANFRREPGNYLQYYKSSSTPKELDKKVLEYYGLEQNLTLSNWRNITQALTDGAFAVGILDGIMNHTGNVYSYLFDYPGRHEVPDWARGENIWYGALHTSETSYIWNRNELIFSSNFTEKELVLSNKLVKMVTNFVKYGNPTPNNTGFTWERWTPSNQSFLYVDPQTNVSIKRYVLSETYRFWKSLNYRDLYEPKPSGSQTVHQFFLLPSLSFFIFIVQYLY